MKKTNSHRLVTYIKLPHYVAAYLKSVYRANGDGIISIPEHSVHDSFKLTTMHNMMYECIRTNIVPNPTLMRMYSAHSLSQMTVELSRNNTVKGMELDVDMDDFVAIELPAVIWCHGGWTKTDRSFQFTRTGAQLFRKIAKFMFWAALNAMVSEENRMNGKTIQQQISVFCTRHRICLEDYDTIVRSFRREKKNMVRPLQTLLNGCGLSC